MKKNYFLLLLLCSFFSFGQDLIITGVIDGPLSGGVPKAIELYVKNDISDLSLYGLGSANNGGGSDGEEFEFPADSSATAGTFIYVASETNGFTNFFGFAPNYTSNAANINGDDAIELFYNDQVIDVLGDINVDGTGQPWEHLDGWAYRNNDATPNNGVFNVANWTFSGKNALDGETTNANATTPFPIGTYSEGPALLISGVIDGPLSGGVPKAIELYVRKDIADLSTFGIGSANNGGGSDGQEFTFPSGASAQAGTYIYIASETNGFTNFFGFAPNYTSSAASINGDDAIELFSDGEVIDVFGDINVDGTGKPWEYLDGWAYRKNNTGPDGNTFVIANWTFSGKNALDGSSTNDTAGSPFPIGTYGGNGGGNNPDPIELISILDARNKNEGEIVKITGVLTVSDQLGGAAYIQDGTAGIAIFDEKVHGENTFSIGDSITVTGVRGAFRQLQQISPVQEVENHGSANQPIQPLTITLSQLADHPSELVRIENVNFLEPGGMFFSSTNYAVNDTSGTSEIRIDNDVDGLIGLGYANTCSEIIAVASRFEDSYQLYPRQASDLPCAQDYVVPENPASDINQNATLDVVTWNIKWFGSDTKSPAAGNPEADRIQKDSVKTILSQLNADIYAVQEIVDVPLFEELLNELPEYNYVISDAVSYPNSSPADDSQKLAFIYKTETVSVVESKALLKSIHPYYNGGDDSALTNYPVDDKTRFFASGRLPFLMTANVTINGETEAYSFINIHGRANSRNGNLDRYNMRKYDMEVLKDSLDTHFNDKNLVFLGDYNDDLDETVVASDVGTTVSSYVSYVQDTANYTPVTLALSNLNRRSFYSRNNMIDHIILSNELNDNYLDKTATVHYEFYDQDYPFTTSDHFPISARLQLKALSIVNSSYTDVTCAGAANGTATVNVNGGIAPYEYLWNDGQDTQTATELTPGEYSVLVVDAVGNTITQEFTIAEGAPLNASTTEDLTLYLGYYNSNCTTLSVLSVNGGSGEYTYEWSTGETTESINVCPEVATQYTVTITDTNGCSITNTIDVDVIDISCGYNGVEICYYGRTLCVPEWAVYWYLYHGAGLGSCDDTQVPFITELNVYPNPFASNLNVNITPNIETMVDLKVYNFYGRLVFETQEQLYEGENTFTYDLSHLPRGFYYLKSYIDGDFKKVKVLVKR